MTRRLVNVLDPVPTFDPLIHCRFRGKALADLSREDLLEALVQALQAAHTLNSIR